MKELFTLGELYVSDFIPQEVNLEIKRSTCQPVEMKLMLEEQTGAVRLEKVAPLESMYGKYWYRSGVNQTMRDELKNVVDSILKVVRTKENDIWVDIACFPEGNYVNTIEGNRDIRDIQVGDFVLSHDNIYHKVIRKYERDFSGDFIKLKIQTLNLNTIVTSNHEYLTKRGWIRAGELEIGDELKIGSKISEFDEEYFNLYEYLKNIYPLKELDLENFTSTSNGIKHILPKIIKIDDEFIKMIAYYIGEGSGGGGASLQFSFNITEMDKAIEIKNYFETIFKINVEIVTLNKSLRIRLHSRVLVILFENLCGYTAFKKKIPHQVLNDKNISKFLKYLWFTDGHLTNHRNRHGKYRKNYIYSSVSKNLILDLWNILTQCGIRSSVQCVKNNRGFSLNDGYIFRITIENKNSVKKLENLFSNIQDSDNFAVKEFVKVLEIEKILTQDKVYNLEVEDSNTYICNGVVVHNCNDGTMFEYIPEHLIKIGVDPADDSFKNEAEKKADLIIQDYFNYKSYSKTRFGKQKAKIVTVIAMFYDLEKPDEFLQDVYKILDNDGLFVMQMSYTPLMLEQIAFDNFCHEHVYYYSLFNIKTLLERNGFSVVDCTLNDINGGSFRLFIKKTEQAKKFYTQPYRDVCDFRINSLLQYEKTLKIDEVETWTNFYQKINELKDKTVAFIKEEKAKGKKIWGYGACHDTETRVVTEDGIKKYDDVQLTDRVYTLNTTTGEVELSPINEILIFPYDGDMIHFKGKRIDMVVTPNHNMLFQTEWNKDYRFEIAEKISKRDRFSIPKGKWTGTMHNEKILISDFVNQSSYSNKCTKIQNEFETSDFMYLLGLFIGDGYVSNQKGDLSIKYCIPRKDKARNRLIETLNRMNLAFREYENEIHVASLALRSIFLGCEEGAKNKRIPKWALQYSPMYLRYLLDGLIDSDGWYEKNNRERLATSSFDLVKDTIELCIKLGYFPTFGIRKVVKKPKIKGREINSSVAYIVNIGKHQPVCYNREGYQTTKEKYTGNIWCLSVDNKNFLIERNGKIAFSGNSTKGNTTLQYFGLDNTLIDGIAERSVYKWGLKTIGTNIPIYSEEEMRNAKPDYLLVLPWHFINEFIEREKDYLAEGGKFIVPCPKFEVIGY